MSKPDTNQASKGDLKQYLHEMHHRIMGDYDGDPDREHPYQDESKSYFWEDEAKNLSELIRTEKLKLLAEVRERVIGEDRKEHSPYCGIGCPHDELIDLYRCTCGLIGSPRNKQLEELTKLEAEL